MGEENPERCPPDPNGRSPFLRFMFGMWKVLDGPVTWFRGSVVEPNRPTYPWYHQKFRRVPTIDECYEDDPICVFEANAQFKRDRQVDTEILNILRMRMEDCMVYEAPDHVAKCKHLLDIYEKGAENWFTKYGDLGVYGDVKTAYMKQKHRMIWERRHGPVGSGMKGAGCAPTEAA